jgi:hypothetical protein
MVRALLAGRKTQTRRLAKSKRHSDLEHPFRQQLGEVREAGEASLKERAAEDRGFAPGDRLWVRETWGCHSSTDANKPREIEPGRWPVFYKADGEVRAGSDWSITRRDEVTRLRPSIFMPRWASRIWLFVTDVRTERLQDIGEDDAKAEGVEPSSFEVYRDAYRQFWSVLHDKPGERWADNPWVIAITFVVHRGNIDRASQEHSSIRQRGATAPDQSISLTREL